MNNKVKTHNKICRKDIAKEVGSTHNLPQSESLKIVDTVFTFISSELMNGTAVEIRGFGSFIFKKRKTRPAMNVVTGERILVPGYEAICFIPGKRIRKNKQQRQNNIPAVATKIGD